MDVKTLTSDRKSMCVSAIAKLRGSLCICLTYGNGEHPTLGFPYLYIYKSRRITLTGDFVANKLTSTNHVRSLICRDKSKFRLESLFSVSICHSWSNMRPVACRPHTSFYNFPLCMNLTCISNISFPWASHAFQKSLYRPCLGENTSNQFLWKHMEDFYILFPSFSLIKLWFISIYFDRLLNSSSFIIEMGNIQTTFFGICSLSLFTSKSHGKHFTRKPYGLLYYRLYTLLWLLM